MEEKTGSAVFGDRDPSDDVFAGDHPEGRAVVPLDVDGAEVVHESDGARSPRLEPGVRVAGVDEDEVAAFEEEVA